MNWFNTHLTLIIQTLSFASISSPFNAYLAASFSALVIKQGNLTTILYINTPALNNINAAPSKNEYLFNGSPYYLFVGLYIIIDTIQITNVLIGSSTLRVNALVLLIL
jgi:hypothetical protein